MKIICYGDSNTYGFDPRGPIPDRYPNPWPQVLAQKGNWYVINDGKNGRNVPRRAVPLPEAADLLIVMLGTNDLLHFRSVEVIAQRMEHFLSVLPYERGRLLLLAPPPIVPGAWVDNPSVIDSARQLADSYENLAKNLGIRFANPQKWDLPMAFDGVHLREEAQEIFAEQLYQMLKNL